VGLLHTVSTQHLKGVGLGSAIGAPQHPIQPESTICNLQFVTGRYAMGDLAGHNLGPYRILEQVGAGGMATVYKAYHAAMDRYVAIKVLPQHLARDPNFRARFQREARTIARLEHRYILPVHDVGEEGDIPYFVMRYTDGGDLNDLIARKSLTVARIAAIVAQVAEALAYAHRQGIIHRDVKPANILISRDGDPLLTDFGIAKIYEETLQLTGEGMMVGTPTYMAPEQLQGQPVDPRTDIYALGVVLYQALTGEPPFVAETPLAVALMHIHNPLRPPRQLNAIIPESIERVILRAMAKNPADRYQTADEMSEALHQALTGLSRPTAELPAAADGRRPSADDRKPTTAGNPSTPAATPLQPLATAMAADSSGSTAGAPAAGPPAARRLSPLWIGAGALGIAAVALAIVLLRGVPAGGDRPTAGQPGATAAPVAPAAPVVPAGTAVTPRANLSALTNTAIVNDLAVLGDVVWAATDGGLVRYGADGAARAFSVADGLPFNWTSTIAAGPDGALYLGAYSAVARVRPTADGLGEVSFYGDKQGVDVGQIYTFMIDSDQSIWLGGENGVRRFDGTTWRTPDLPLDDPAVKDARTVRTLLRSRDGALWAGLAEGLLRWDGKRWTRFSESQGVGAVGINRLLQDTSGTIWAAAGGAGLLRFDAAQDRWQKVVVLHDGEDIRSIAQLADGRLWSAGNDGLAGSADGGARWEAIQMPDQFAGWVGSGAVVQDSAGRIWIGAGAGVSCCAAGQWRAISAPAGLPFVGVGSLTQAPNGKLWAIEEYGGVAALVDPASLAIKPFSLPDARIRAFAFTADTVWIGTQEGLIRQRGGAQLRITTADGLPSDDIRSMLATDTTLWIGTVNGLAMYDLAAEKVVDTVPDFENGIINLLFHAPDSAVWASSIKENDTGKLALGRYDGKTWQIWAPGDQPMPENSSGVTKINADSQGQVWIATWNAGLYTWDGGAWRSWSEGDGAPGGNILALAPLDGALWMGGQTSGLYRWNKDGWKPIAIDGLSSYVTDLRFTEDGALWLATGDGLLRLSKEGVAALK
jgi:serine/threonine-protein kinase